MLYMGKTETLTFCYHIQHHRRHCHHHHHYEQHLHLSALSPCALVRCGTRVQLRIAGDANDNVDHDANDDGDGDANDDIDHDANDDGCM